MQDNDDTTTTALTEAKAPFEALGSRLQCLRSLRDIYCLQNNYNATAALTKAKASLEVIGDRPGCLESLGIVYS